MMIQAASAPVEDIEIVAQTVRYARAATPGFRARTILSRLKKDYPDVESHRILSCMGQAADLLLAQHTQ